MTNDSLSRSPLYWRIDGAPEYARLFERLYRLLADHPEARGLLEEMGALTLLKNADMAGLYRRLSERSGHDPEKMRKVADVYAGAGWFDDIAGY